MIFGQVFYIYWNNTIEVDKEDVNHYISKFMEQINVLLDKYMPLKEEFNRRYIQWITDKILGKIVIKNRIFKKFINCQNPDKKSQLNIQFKLLKNEITALTRESKKQYYESFFLSQ